MVEAEDGNEHNEHAVAVIVISFFFGLYSFSSLHNMKDVWNNFLFCAIAQATALVAQDQKNVLLPWWRLEYTSRNVGTFVSLLFLCLFMKNCFIKWLRQQIICLLKLTYKHVSMGISIHLRIYWLQNGGSKGSLGNNLHWHFDHML